MAGRARSLNRQPAFWDSSALVPLCINEAGTPKAITLLDRYSFVVWRGTAVEIASALARLARARAISADELAGAKQLAERLAREWRVVEPTNSLWQRAIRMVETYDLRAADALQLSAALEWCELSPAGRTLLSSDERLARAATLAGFDAQRI